MSVEIKICGLSTPKTMEAALQAGADYVGLMFYEPSPRFVDWQTARMLADNARGRAKIVAVVVDADDGLLERIRDEVRPDFVQLHGSETRERIADIVSLTGAGIIKAVKVRDAEDIKAAESFAGSAGIILFDAKAPETLVDALPGGNGLCFDWTLVHQGGQANFMLSGGLHAGNVAGAIDVTKAPAVDVSSGVETSPGKKDPDLIRKFVAAVKSARVPAA